MVVAVMSVLRTGCLPRCLEREVVVGGAGARDVDELGIVLDVDHRSRPVLSRGGREYVDKSEDTDFAERRKFPERDRLMQALRHVDSVGQAPGGCGVKHGADSIDLDARELWGTEAFDELILDR